MSKKIKIIKGEDRLVPLDIIRRTDSDVKRPYNLTGWTKITCKFRQANNAYLVIDTVPAHGRNSSGDYEGVTYTASNVGVIGDNIILTFDGVIDIATAISNWNSSNPANTVTSNAEDDTVVPIAGSIQLSGGLDDYSKVTVIGDPRDGKIQVAMDNEDTNALKNGNGQGVIVEIDFGDHDLGKRRIASAKNVLNVEVPSV